MGSIRDEGGAFPIHLLFYGALGYAVYWTYNRGWWHQAWEWWEWRGMASVQLSAEVEFDLTVEKEKVPDRFLAVLHRIHQYLIDQRIHAQCMSFQVLTPLRGATDTDETAMSYLMPVGSRKLRLTDGKASIWIKTSISTRDPPEGNNGGGNNNSMGFGMGNARLLAPKQSVLVEVYSKGSSAALDATLKRWEVEYNKHIEELLHSKLTVLRPEVRHAPVRQALVRRALVRQAPVRRVLGAE